MGSTAFEAQYQQNPVPMLGNIFKAWWFHDWPEGFDPAEGGEILQSWDTGIKTGNENAFSVCITAIFTGDIGGLGGSNDYDGPEFDGDPWLS